MSEHGSIRLPEVDYTAPTTVPELLAFATLPYYQVSGNLTTGETAVEIGDPIAWNATADKWINYNQGGSGDETTCIGFVRIPGDPTGADVPIEVVVGGAVKYSLVSAASAWHSDILTDLYARYVKAADALIF